MDRALIMKKRFTFSKTFAAVLAAACLLAQGAELQAQSVAITEVAPWSSGNSPVGADWFEVTNVSTSTVNITGWKVDDDSASFSSALVLNGVTSIAPGESVIFVEGSASVVNTFKTNWFGSNVPAGLQVGTYSGSGIGLGTGGDQVNLYNAAGVLQAKVIFGASDNTSPYSTFDNTAALNNATISLLSAVGVNGAFVPVNNSGGEIGSPGHWAPGVLRITEVAPWASGNSPAEADWFEVTNMGTKPVNMTGWKVDDSSGNAGSASAALALNGIASIAPGESVIYMETSALSTTKATFLSTWFGSNPPENLQVGSYSGSGIGLSGDGDGLNLFDSSNTRHVNVTFGASPTAAPFATFDNTAGVNLGAISQLSVVGVNGAFVALNDANEIGSPGGLPPGATATVGIANGSVNEGNSGSTTLALVVTRSNTTTAFTVEYAVTGGTATAGTDYTALASGTLTFAVGGATTQTISISVTGDTVAEPDETVVVTLSNVVSTTGTTTISTAVGTGTIVNDDASAPIITTHPVNVSIASGSVTTLSVVASGTPAPTYQWYVGNSGDTSSPVSSATGSSFTTPALTTTTSYWVRATNTGGSANSNTVTVSIATGVTEVNLANYVRVGRYNLPEYRRTALPAGTASHNLLCDEASGVTYNWDTGTLFICGDGGKSVTQVTKTGQLVDTMSLALNAGNPQGVEFYDPEGITYIGGGQFVLAEERERRLVKFTYAAGTTLTRANAQSVKIGTFDDNTGTEGLSYDPQTNSGPNPGFIVLKEKNPIGVFQTNVDFAAGTATNGSASTTNSTNLFNTALLGMTDVADVFAFSNIPSMAGQPQSGNMLILGQENARILNVSRTGVILSTLNITSDAGNPLSAPDQQHEGITMDREGNIYIVNENGGGSIEYPQLWVYAPSTQANQAPTAVVVGNAVTSLQENTSTAMPVKMGDISVTDDGLGTNTLSLSGADADFFELNGAVLYLKAGTVLDYESGNTSYTVTISVDDTTVGSTPDATVNFTLTVTDQEVEAPPAPVVIISEVAPWSSGGAVAGDWFEVTNVSAGPVTLTGWKVDDSNPSFATAIALNGITTIAAGESVIFIEGTAANQATIANTFRTNWFGGNPPAGLQIGTYVGSGIGLGTSGDAVNLYNSAGVLQASVNFGAADSTVPLSTFDNTAGLNATTISLLSAVGVNGAFVAVNNAGEIGSPGYSAPGELRITEVAAWGSGNSPAAADWFEVTNIGGRAVDMTGWKMDDSSESPAAALALTGIASIAPGESVIYMETATPVTTRATFLHTWFGTTPPAGLQVGSYSGSGAGLSTGSDAVNLFDSSNVRRANVSFGISPSSAPFASFDNTAGVNVGVISQLSSVGYNGAFAALNDDAEIGSPGTCRTSSPVSFNDWLTQNGFTGSTSSDTDGDGVTDTLEYFFNTNPNSSSDMGNLPQMSNSGAGMELSFSYLNTSMFAGYVESSDNLRDWFRATRGQDYEVVTQVMTGEETAVRFRILTDPTPTAQGPFSHTVPFTTTVERGAIDALTITNHGMVGAGRLTGDQLDKFGETMGAASGLAITGWGYNAGTGQFSGTFQVLPDRGYNSGDFFSNYAARVHAVPFTFTPYYGSAPVAQTQVMMTYGDTTKFTYVDGATVKFTTGLNPTGTSTVFGQTVGTVMAANGEGGAQENLLSFDAEAIHLFADGSGFVTDEYGTYIARFNSSKQITGLTQLPGAAQPFRPAGVPNFDSVNPPTTGRRNNQGLEGMSVSPDNTRLIVVMQSALVQDTGAGGQGRYHTRVYVYDIEGAKVEAPVLISEHVLQLPRYTLNGNGGAVNTTAAQSEIVALSNTQFLVLPRDGNGQGKGDTNPPVLKTVDLVDISLATNILGLYDAAGAAVSPGGVLVSGVVPAKSTVVVNLLSSTDLTRFGFNTNTTAPTPFTVAEKIEGMALVPDLSTPSPHDFFLFVANDNDFRSTNVKMVNAAGVMEELGDARDRGIVNDAVYTVWRLTIQPNNRKFFRVGVDVPAAP